MKTINEYFAEAIEFIEAMAGLHAPAEAKEWIYHKDLVIAHVRNSIEIDKATTSGGLTNELKSMIGTATDLAENTLEMTKNLPGSDIATNVIKIKFDGQDKSKMEAVIDVLQQALPEQASTIKKPQYPKDKKTMTLHIEVLEQATEQLKEGIEKVLKDNTIEGAKIKVTGN